MTPLSDAMKTEHWGADESFLLDPEQELETIELGDRAGWWLTLWLGARVYSDEDSRIHTAKSVMVASVAEATSHRGLPYPPEWWPADAGPVPAPSPVAAPKGRS